MTANETRSSGEPAHDTASTPSTSRAPHPRGLGVLVTVVVGVVVAAAVGLATGDDDSGPEGLTASERSAIEAGLLTTDDVQPLYPGADGGASDPDVIAADEADDWPLDDWPGSALRLLSCGDGRAVIEGDDAVLADELSDTVLVPEGAVRSRVVVYETEANAGELVERLRRAEESYHDCLVEAGDQIAPLGATGERGDPSLIDVGSGAVDGFGDEAVRTSSLLPASITGGFDYSSAVDSITVRLDNAVVILAFEFSSQGLANDTDAIETNERVTLHRVVTRVAGALGSDVPTGAEGPFGAPTAAALAAALEPVIRVDLQLLEPEPDQQACFSERLVETLGVDRLLDAGIRVDDLGRAPTGRVAVADLVELEQEDTGALVDAYVQCFDPAHEIFVGFEEAGYPTDVAGCAGRTIEASTWFEEAVVEALDAGETDAGEVRASAGEVLDRCVDDPGGG